MEITKRNYHKATYMSFSAIEDAKLFQKLSARKSFQYKKVKYTLQFTSPKSYYYHTSNNEIVRISDHWCNKTSINTTYCLNIKSCIWMIEGVNKQTPHFYDFDGSNDIIFVAGVCKLSTAISISKYEEDNRIMRENQLNATNTLSLEEMLTSLNNTKNELVNTCKISIINTRDYVIEKERTVVFDVKTPFTDKYSKQNTALISFKQNGKIQYIGACLGNKFFNDSTSLIQAFKTLG